MELFNELKSRTRSVPRRTLAMLAILFLSGAVFAFALRFVLVERQDTHYHANFALYVNGSRDKFESFAFYEEIAACSDSKDSPRGRVHMHNQVSHIVHVHDRAVTWGNFFENLSYGLNREVLKTDDGVFIDGVDGKELVFVLNGKQVSDITNTVIQSEDALLVEYGTPSPEQLNLHYQEITKDAGEYNKKPDPSACQGGDDEPFKDRFLRTLGKAEEH